MSEDDLKRAAECGVTPETYQKAALTLLYYVTGHLVKKEPVRLVATARPERAASLILSPYNIHFVDAIDAETKHNCTLDELEPRLLLVPAHGGKGTNQPHRDLLREMEQNLHDGGITPGSAEPLPADEAFAAEMRWSASLPCEIQRTRVDEVSG